MKVRPACEPQSADKAVAHFYTNEATNTFIIERNALDLRVSIHPRNEHLNTDSPIGLYGRIRNFLVGFGSWLGISKTHWVSLINALLHRD